MLMFKGILLFSLAKSALSVPQESISSQPVCEVSEQCKQTCANPNPANCSYTLPTTNQDGCGCQKDWVLWHVNGTCIKSEDCPTSCSITDRCKRTCTDPNPQNCSHPPSSTNENGCNCQDGWLLAQNGTCIKKEYCPNYCPVSEECKRSCTNPNPPNCPLCSTDKNQDGCNCREGWLLSENKTCIREEECPNHCPVSEECKRSCTNPNPPNCPLCPTDKNQDGCNCKEGWLLSENQTCIREEECSNYCSVSEECQRTCINPNPTNCPYCPSDKNQDGCNCQEGWVLLHKNGPCTKIEDCPNDKGCNGDPKAKIVRCPNRCASTCEAPNASICNQTCDEPIGCECFQGHIFSKLIGKCVLPHKCPGGNPCGITGRFSTCRTNCTEDYCPTDDRRGSAPCKTNTCLPGCICNPNYRRKSVHDPTCIKSILCPPVPCKRVNERWEPCVSPFHVEKCEDLNKSPSFNITTFIECQPGCTCKKHYYRNATDCCVPAKDCNHTSIVTKVITDIISVAKGLHPKF